MCIVTTLNTRISTSIFRARQKSSTLKHFAYFSRTIEKCDIKFYAIVTNSLSRKSVKFHYVMYRIDKIMLLLVMAT